MQIATYLDNDSESCQNFSLWRNRAAGDWTESIVGEWSTMSGTFGTHRYLYKVSNCGKFWALKVNGFPTRIVAAAFTDVDASIEQVIGKMVRQVADAGGEWIDGVFDSADGFNLDIFWKAYDRVE